MDKLLVILGPTATGKTDLGVSLAKKYKGEIVSADSRQVYKGMDIGTGKDLEESSKLKVQSAKFHLKTKKFSVGYRLKNDIPIWLVDVVPPDYQFNVGEYSQIAKIVIKNIQNRKKLPIVVGGTGLYIRSILEPLNSISIPPNEKLREEIKSFSIQQLQEKLKETSMDKWDIMNNSDRYNPRRLIRAIEIELSNQQSSPAIVIEKYHHDELIVGLTAGRDILNERIKERVEKRIREGILEEIEALLNQGYTFDLPSFSASGYKIWKEYFQSEDSRKKDILNTIVKKWILQENQYAKRQMTFFRKMEKINWFDINDENFLNCISDQVKRWYNKMD